MKKLATSILIAMCGGVSNAQLAVDIGAFPNMVDTTLDIRLRPHGDFGDVVTGFSFTLRWPVALGGTFLGTRVLTCPDALTISPVAIQEDTGYYSRIFNAFGTELLADWGCEWQACEERMVMYLPAGSSVGLDQVEIVPGSYTISGGLLAPGLIYPWGPCATAMEDQWSNTQPEENMVFPVPADNVIQVQGGRRGRWAERLCAFSTDGRPFLLASLGGGKWDVTSLSPGIYLLQAEGVWIRFVKH